MRVDVPAALEGQVRDDPNYSRLTITACAVQVRAAIQSLSVALDWARIASTTDASAALAANYIEDGLRLLEGAPERANPPQPHKEEGG